MNSLKGIGKILLATLMIYTSSGLSNSISTDYQTRNNSSKIRTELKLSDLELKTMNVSQRDSLKRVSLKASGSTDLLDRRVKLTLRYNKNGENQSLVISPAVSQDIAGIDTYLEPMMITTDSQGRIKEVDGFAKANWEVSSIKGETAICYLHPTEGKDSHASYISAKNDNLGVGLSESYDGSLGLQVGYKNDQGNAILGILDYQPDNKTWSLTTFGSQKTSGFVGPSGPKIWDDCVVIGQPEIDAPYFTGTANKTTEGLAGKVNVSGRNKKINSVTVELGYNTGQNVSFTVSETYNFETNTTSSQGTATYTNKGLTLEGKVNSDGDYGVYGSYSIDF